MFGLFEAAHAPEIPVACGRAEAFPAATPPSTTGASADNYGAQVTTGGRKEDERSAAEPLADTIAAAPGEIVIIALGPLTNLAEAFQPTRLWPARSRDRDHGWRIRRPGQRRHEAEGISNEYAEWNFFADPTAADTFWVGAHHTGAAGRHQRRAFTRGLLRTTLRADARPGPAVSPIIYLNPWWLDGGMYWWDTLTGPRRWTPA